MTALERLTQENERLSRVIQQQKTTTKIIQDEKTNMLEKFWVEIEEIEKLKPFWRFWRYVRLSTDLFLEIKAWRELHKKNRVKKNDRIIHVPVM